MRSKILISFIIVTILANFVLAKCPSADLNGDCFVDFEDFSQMANQWPFEYDYNDLADMATQWLTTDPCFPDDMAYIPDGEFEMGDHDGSGFLDELPVHSVLLDSFFISKFEITNQQYCDYLNSAYDACDIKVDAGIVYASSDDSNSFPYCDTHSSSDFSQIDYNNVSETFSVMTKSGRDMSNDPMVEVNWYGAAAYCNWRSQQEGYQALYDLSDPNWSCDFSKHGYRLPTEAEWEYAARGGEHAPYYRYPWGDIIDGNMANYYNSGDPYENGTYPWTTPVGYYNGNQTPAGSDMANGYGLYDMAGNVWEWCNDWYGSYKTCVPSPCDNPTGPASGSYRIVRGGNWYFDVRLCRVTFRGVIPGLLYYGIGFRVVLDLN